MRKYSLRQLLGVMFVCAILIFIIRRPLQGAIESMEGKGVQAALISPWWLDAYILGFDDRWPEGVSLKIIDNAHSGHALTGYVTILIISIILWLIVHGFGVMWTYAFIKDTFF